MFIDLQVSDLVLFYENNQSPLSWPLGRIIELVPGSDRVVQVAVV